MDGSHVIGNVRKVAEPVGFKRRGPTFTEALACLPPLMAAALAAFGLAAAWGWPNVLPSAWVAMEPIQAGLLLLASLASGSLAAETWLGIRFKALRDTVTGLLGTAGVYGLYCAVTHAGWPPHVDSEAEVCVSFAAISMALITLRHGGPDSLAAATARGAAVAIAGVCFADSIGDGRVFHPALAGIFLCGLGLLAAGASARPAGNRGCTGPIGMSVVRRIIPFAIVVPAVGTSILVRAAWLMGLDGDTLVFLNAVLLVLLLTGIILCFGRAIDRLDARRAEAEGDVAAALERLATAQEAAGAAFWEWDPATQEVTWSSELLNLHGLDPELNPRKWPWNDSPMHPDDRPRVLTALRATARGRGPINERHRSLHVEGRTLHFATRGRLTGEGAARRVVGLAFDVTDRVMAEELSSRAVMLAERTNATKSKFLAAASHDMRQPLQGLFLFAGALRERLLRQRAPDRPALDLVDAFERALGAMRTLMDSLLDVSKIDAGLVVVRPQDVEIGPLLQRVVERHAGPAAAHGLRLRAVPTSAVASVDPSILERIVGNLVENAVRYTAAGGVVVGVRRRRGGAVRVEVADTGIGIGIQDHDGIWEEFEQLANPGRDRAKGLGLGLAVVRRLAALAGHHVGMRSLPNRGSRFWIDLPPARNDAPSPEEGSMPVADRGIDGGVATILVIDDEEMLRSGFAATLEAWGYGVLLASDEQQALAVVASHGAAPSAILADHRLRDGRTGIQAVAAIRKQARRPIPALLVTGDTDPARLSEAESADFRLVHKPVPTDALRRVLAELVG